MQLIVGFRLIHHILRYKNVFIKMYFYIQGLTDYV